MRKSTTTEWTKEENKKFESALAIYDEMTPNRWSKVAEIIPGKSVLDVMLQYKELVADVTDIEAGLVPNPRHFASSFALEYVDHRKIQTFSKRGKSYDHERKKGVPWTEEEHRFIQVNLLAMLLGFFKYVVDVDIFKKNPSNVGDQAYTISICPLACSYCLVLSC